LYTLFDDEIPETLCCSSVFAENRYALNRLVDGQLKRRDKNGLCYKYSNIFAIDA